jgi:hypothetical protein
MMFFNLLFATFPPYENVTQSIYERLNFVLGFDLVFD